MKKNIDDVGPSSFVTRYGTIDFAKLRASDIMLSLGQSQPGVPKVKMLKSRNRYLGSPFKFHYDWDQKPAFTPLPTLREICTAFDLDLGHQVLDFVYGREYRPMDAGMVYCPYIPLTSTWVATPPLTIKSVLTPHINTGWQQLPELLKRILSLSLN